MVYVIIYFAIIIFSYLALIRLLFVELGFCQIKRKYIQYNTIQYNTIQYNTIPNYFSIYVKKGSFGWRTLLSDTWIILKMWLFIKQIFQKITMHKLCENMVFHWPVSSRIRTESTILSLYRRIRVGENSFLAYFIMKL